LTKDKIYFASDFHLGSPNMLESHERERQIVQWLNEIEKEAKEIYLVGDIFDFWFEYNKVVPKGFVRLLGKIASLTDSGTSVHLFAGNHDLWMKDYLETEIGAKIHHRNIIIHEGNKKILIGHGDGLGNGDYFYKILKVIFTSKFCQWIFSRLHPNFSFALAHTWSKNSRKSSYESKFSIKENEILFNYCQEQQKINPVDYYIFGHRHLPLEIKIDEKATYINLGEWINQKTYGVLDNGIIKLESYK